MIKLPLRVPDAPNRACAKAILATVVLALALGPQVSAQQPSTNPPVPPAQAAPGPNAGQMQQAAPAETVQNGQQQVQLIFSPWARYCTKGVTEQSSEIRAKAVCFTAADGHLTSGQKLVIALLIEPGGRRYEAVTRHATLGRGVSPR